MSGTTIEIWYSLIQVHQMGFTQHFFANSLSFVALAMLVISLIRPLLRLALFGFVLIHVATIVHTFPTTANHHYLFTIVVFLLWLFDPRKPQEAKWALGSIQLLFIIMIVWAGAQKMLHGYYLTGGFFAFRIAHSPHFLEFLSFILPAEELQRLSELRGRVGDGPYRLTSIQGLVFSNLAYIVELILPLGLFWQRTRRVSILALFVFIALTQAAARELTFGLFFVATLFLFEKKNINRFCFPLFATAYLYLLAARLELVPLFLFY